MKKSIYDKFHQGLADKYGLTLRDIKYFRQSFYGGKSKLEIAEKLQDKLLKLRGSGSYRYDFYLRRLAFLSKCTDNQWKDITKISKIIKEEPAN